MPRLPADAWAEIRARREGGASFGELARDFGVSKAAIFKRAKAEGWGDGKDVSEAIRRRAMAKVNGLVDGAAQKRAEALEDAANRAAEVLQRHRLEWQAHRQAFGAVPSDFEQGKAAKIAAEMLTVRQRGERLAWGIDEGAAAPKVVIVRQW